VIDFSSSVTDPLTGLECVMSPAPAPIVKAGTLLSCIYSTTSTCHYSMFTMFRQHREQMFDEYYHKNSHIVFTRQAREETMQHCYTPMVRECREGEEDVKEDCKEVFDTECITLFT
jgi:hypothetical protein